MFRVIISPIPNCLLVTRSPAGSFFGVLYHKLQTQSSAPEDGRKYLPKHVELNEITNKLLPLHLVGCLYYYIRDARSHKHKIHNMFTTRIKFHKLNYNDQLDNSMKAKAKHISTRDGYFAILHPTKILYEDTFQICRRSHRNKGYIEIRVSAVRKTKIKTFEWPPSAKWANIS